VAASILRADGFNDVSWVAEGLPSWRAQGHPVEQGEPSSVGAADDGPPVAAGHGHSSTR
jgi:3-mercaptopyruvate sulfurtransferase SseA